MLLQTSVNDVEITTLQRVLPALAALLIAGVTIELIRRRRLREEYAMLWIAASVLLVVFAIYPRLLLFISQALGIFYLTTLVLLCFSFLALMLLHLAVSVSRSGEDIRQLAQRLALLERRIEEALPPPHSRPQAPTIHDVFPGDEIEETSDAAD